MYRKLAAWGFSAEKFPNLFSFLNEGIQDGGSAQRRMEEKQMAGIRQIRSDPVNDRRAFRYVTRRRMLLCWVTSAGGAFRFSRRLGLVLVLQVLR